MLATDGTQLLGAFDEFNETAAGTYRFGVAEMTAQAGKARAEGDLRDDVEPVGRTPKRDPQPTLSTE